MAYPGQRPGDVTIDNDPKNPKIFKAHESELSAIALNKDGTRLATASVKGTLIRVWNTQTLEKIAELRRGTDSAAVNCLNFSSDSKHLCISSNKGTIHIFTLTSPEQQSEKSEEKGVWGYIPSFAKGGALWRWSRAQFHITEPYSICAFGEENCVIVVSADGSFHRYTFNEKEGGETSEGKHTPFLKRDEGGEERSKSS